MAPFRFTLEQVLRYREQLKEQAQVEFARVQAALLNEQQRAEQLQVMLEESQGKYHNLPPSEQGERWLLEHFIRGLREDIAVTLQRIRVLMGDVEKARLVLATRAKDHKILEKLKEKQADRHAQEERLKEQRIYDETASIRFKAQTF